MWQDKKFVVLVAVLVLAFCVVLRLRFSPGERDAQKDLASGHYILLGYGLPVQWASEYDQCLAGYGIEVRNIGGDVFVNGRDRGTGYDLSYYQSYNAVSSAAIKQQFGPNVFALCNQTARSKWESSHPESKPKHLP